MTTQLSGQFQLFAATEGTSLPPATTEVASFSDPNLTDTAGDFTATIVWGDGNTSTGTVSGSNGSFTVDGGNTYESEGFFNATVTIVRNADNSQLALGGAVEVTGDDQLTGSSGLTFTGAPNQPLTNVTVATFTNTNTVTPANDFTTEIDWGDGTTSAGALMGSNGSFTVSGSHTYAAAGDYTITTFMDDIIPDGAVGIATAQADIGFGGNETLNAATATVAVPTGTAVADFGDSLASPSGDYTATIDWGDGTAPTSGTVAGSNGQYIVTSTAAHTYADFGDFTLTVTVVNTANSDATTSMAGTVVVDSGESISGAGVPISGDPSQAINNVAVATFTDSDAAVTANQLAASIDWGDGTLSAGTIISGAAGSFTVDGSHTYAAGGNYTTTVTLADDLPGTAVGTASAMATINFSGQMVLNSANENTALPSNTTVATFNDNNLGDTASDFTATINWGDGTSSAGTISAGGAGTFTVNGGHTYSVAGNEQASVTLIRTADQVQSTVSGNVFVTDANSFTPQTLSTGVNGDQMTVQAAFTDTDTVTLASDLEASINWGDGSVTAGTVTGSNGAFTVTGAHTYATAVSTNLTVTLDDSPGTAAASNSIALSPLPMVTGAANVNASPSQSFTASALFSASDVEAAPLTYQVEDESIGPSQGFWVLNGAVLPNGQLTMLSAAQLPQLSFVAGASSSTSVTDTLEVVASDAVGSTPFTFTVTASKLAPGDVAPTVTAANVQIAPNQSVAGSSLFSASVPQGETIVSYEVEDTTTDSGHWMFNGVVEPTNQVIDVTVAQLAQLSFDTGYGSDTLMVRANDGTQWSSFRSFTVTPPPNAAPPAGTADTLVMLRNADGAFEFYDIGHNAILLDGPVGQINPALQVAGVGGFNGADTADLLMRDPATGVFTLYDVSNNNIAGNVGLGQVGTEWQVAGVGDFSTRAGETDMLMRNSNSGAFEVYDISNNTITFSAPMGQVGLEWTVAGFGDFSTRANETDMLMRNSNTGAFELYDIVNNAITLSTGMGQVGLEWTIAGFGDFSTRANETDMLMRNSNTGAFEVYDVANNAITSAGPMGQVGLEWTIAGFGDFSGNANETDMLMRNSNTGAFELYDIRNNAIAQTTGMGQVGLEWSISGVSRSPAGVPPTTQLSGPAVDPAGAAPSSATDQLTQAMAAFAPSDSAFTASSPLDQVTPAPAVNLLGASHV
ncbi:MAG: hypothetical protein WA268_23445 [Xanthobacteraceae bacterium]